MDKAVWKGKNVQAAVLYAIVFLSPLLIGHPQDAVGVIVNAAVVFSALRLGWKRTVPVLVVPVLGVLSRAAAFGPFPPFLPVTVTLAVAGNAVLAFLIIYVRKRLAGLAAGVLAKTALMFAASSILVGAGVLPEAVLSSMGLFQLYTAAAGGAAAVLALEVQERAGRRKKPANDNM